MKRNLSFSIVVAAMLVAVSISVLELGHPPTAKAQSLDPQAHGVSGGVVSELLARGEFDGRFRIGVREPIDLANSRLTFQPGGETGWHRHVGPVFVIVKTGALTVYQANGCSIVYPAGSVFMEEADHVHIARNETLEVTEVVATFFAPPGAPLRIDAGSCQRDPPRSRCWHP